jgi:molybdopterin-containing oxidoreductase family membrane subunit
VSGPGELRAQAGNGTEADAYAPLLAELGPLSRRGKFWAWVLFVIAIWGLVCWAYQLRHGLAVTAMSDYFSWGIYIIDFVFFIGISMAGTFISAMLRLTGAEWRRPITRMAEGITLFALLIAGPMVIMDMGRPDRFFHVLRYGRLQSPILWDVLSLTTYMAGSLLYLYLPMIPDLALLRDQGNRFKPWRRELYAALALGWCGTAEQQRTLERSISLMAIVILPVAISIHTVTAWLFGLTLRPGWHSTIIGPDFVIGALYSGIAAVITAMAIFRYLFQLHPYITAEHFRKLGLLLLVVGLVYFYFTVNEYIGSQYMTQTVETPLLRDVFRGSYALQFWTMVGLGLIAPLVLLVFPWTRNVKGIVAASVLVNVGMWLMRYIIIVPTLAAPYLPIRPGVTLAYVPTWVEWSLTAGGFAAFALMYLLFSKIFPIISIWELAPQQEHAGVHPSTTLAREAMA